MDFSAVQMQKYVCGSKVVGSQHWKSKSVSTKSTNTEFKNISIGLSSRGAAQHKEPKTMS